MVKCHPPVFKYATMLLLEVMSQVIYEILDIHYMYVHVGL